MAGLQHYWIVLCRRRLRRLHTQRCHLILKIQHEILLLLFKCFAFIPNSSKGCWGSTFLDFEVHHATESPGGLRPLRCLYLSAVRTNIFKWLLVFWGLWQLRIDSGKYELHLQVICEVLQSLDFSLQTLDEIFHIATIQALLFLLFWGSRPDYLNNIGSSCHYISLLLSWGYLLYLIHLMPSCNRLW